MSVIQEHWRWNVNHAWENFSCMVEEAFHAGFSANTFERMKRMRSVLEFADVCLESFMNELMRGSMIEAGQSEKAIKDKLKSTGLPQKLNTWPSKLCAKPQVVADTISKTVPILEQQRKLRNRLTHPTEKDHSVYLQLEQTRASDVVDSVGITLVSICEAKPCVYPYWLLGWNFVGFNHDAAQPYLSDSSQFVHALARMGFLPIANAFLADESENWQRSHMTNRAGFLRLKAELDALSYDIEPWFESIPGLGAPPRLCRRWWDRNLVLSTIPEPRT
jgi:hypothetical protein